MKILILSNKPPFPSNDGSSLATLNMATGIAEAGNKVKILAFATQKHPCRVEEIPLELKNLIEFELVKIDTSIKPIKAIVNLVFSRLPFNIERFINISYRQKLIEILKNETFDIIQLEGLYLYPYINDVRFNCSTPIVYRSHNIEHEIWSRIATNERNPLKKFYFSLLSKRIAKLEKKISKQVNAIVAISKRDENWFITNGSTIPTITIPSGYRNNHSSDIKGLNNNDICFVGSLDWIPNQEGLTWFLDSIWLNIRKIIPNTSIHIAGRNAPSSLVLRLKNEPGVVFHGEIKDAKEFLNNFSILVVPLLSGSGMRVRIVEGMMLGKAIVTTSIGIEGIEAHNPEEVIIADDPSEFTNATINLINNSDTRTSIAEKARIFATSHYDIFILTQRLTEFYKQVV